jgi:hypothetical protein
VKASFTDHLNVLCGSGAAFADHNPKFGTRPGKRHVQPECQRPFREYFAVAASMAANSDALFKGLDRMAMTPADSARSRTTGSPWAVMTMVGMQIPLRVR